MRHPILISLCIAGAVGVSGCNRNSDADVKRAMKSVNVIDETNLNDIMLTVGDPNEAVAYFAKASQENPDRIDLKRGLAKSLIRAKKPLEGAKVWAEVAASAEGTNDDKVELADAYIRSNEWAKAETTLNTIPPTHETYERYRLEAMVADANKKWKKADSFYETAFGLTTKPAGVLNNWGFSKLTRGDFGGAEKLFTQALSYDSSNFTTKNNLVLARAGQRKYDLPIISMTQEERAQLLYTAALSAIKQGDVTTGKGLLEDAVETSPRYFEQAQRALDALNAQVAKG
ncbi:Flp pilus assembly protein TadD [Defluviimonas denitrificans]|jgi:Tfp pilus assembly protein PilF|uniref:Flp pilus assembly protein TadD n=1 Tax=Albidovulum denitrificans TaxID=404881 RepID=A0A2S8S962_9RHOB|nr:tetratricopeptide repeat protein [Defluviimonas denitrificans]PQV57367.1 Flp pilus assembly protein TadD [Defluviimonas denitrificans]